MKKAIFLVDYDVPGTTLEIKSGDEFELEGEDSINYYFSGFIWEPIVHFYWPIGKEKEGLYYIIVDMEALH